MKFRKFLLATLAICSLSFGFSSCKDDDDDDNENQEISNNMPDDQTWESLVQTNSWLSAFPAYPQNFGISSSIQEGMVMLGDYNATEEVLAQYQKSLINAGFTLDNMGIYVKGNLNAVVMFQQINEINVLSVNYTKMSSL